MRTLQRFGGVAVDKGYITPQHLIGALQQQKMEVSSGWTPRRIGQILLARGLISEQQIRDVCHVLESAQH
ncbi:MAG: hypothetical protein ACOWYE_09205 [Desulfatiglandales bacterium]